MELLRVNTRDGKYTVIQKENGEMRFLRHGEPWPAADEQFRHVGMILALAQDLSAANRVARAANKCSIRYDPNDELEKAVLEWETDRIINEG